MLILPNELLYLIFEELHPLYLINMRHLSKRINMVCKKLFRKESFRYRLRMQIYNLANGDLGLSICISSIINSTKIYNEKVIQMLKDVYFLVKNRSRYFGILGYSVFYFYIYHNPISGIMNLGRIPNVYDDIFVVNLFFDDIDTLKYYLETFLDFKRNETLDGESNCYKVKNYRMRYILN